MYAMREKHRERKKEGRKQGHQATREKKTDIVQALYGTVLKVKRRENIVD